MKRIVIMLAIAGLVVVGQRLQAASIVRGPGKEKVVKHKANGTTKKETRDAKGNVKVVKKQSNPYGGYEDYN